MKTRLPKMLLTALLAAMTTAYALPGYVTLEGVHQHYQGGTPGNSIDIDDAANFGSGVSADAGSTVSIGYGDNQGNAYNGFFTLDGTVTYSTPDALFIGGPGWPHTLSGGYTAAKGELTVDGGSTLSVATNILMGTCEGAVSRLDIVGGSAVSAVNMQVSNGGGTALVNVGAVEGGGNSGTLYLDGNLSIGVNDVTGSTDPTSHMMNIYKGSRVDVTQGVTSIGYATESYCGAAGSLVIYQGGKLQTGALEMGIGMMNVSDGSNGAVSVGGTLEVTGTTHETLIGIQGGQGMLTVTENGTADLGTANVRVGSTTVNNDTTQGEIVVTDQGTLKHNGAMYVGDKGTVSEETGDPNYGIGYLTIEQGGTANLNVVEVSEDSRICVNGKLTVDETPDAYGIQGVRLYHGAILAGRPDNQGGRLSFSVVPENNLRTDIVIDNFTLTEGTMFKSCCDNHLIVGNGSTLTFGEGTLWLTDGIAFIDAKSSFDAGTITTTAGTGNISVKYNEELNGWLDYMGSVKSGSGDKVALISADSFIEEGGTFTGMLEETGTLKLDRAGFEVRFTDEAVSTLNEGDSFRGFYVVKTEYPAEEAYPTFDRNQREVYDHIKKLDEEGTPMPDELKKVITDVLNTDGIKDGDTLRETLDFLGAVNYSVMMHNQIEGNLSHQRLLRNRSTVGRNLRHGKGCTDLYAAGFFDNQRAKYSRAKGEGYRRSEWGGIIGGDTCINENLRLGADVALGWSNISPTHNMKLKQRSVYWDVYAQYRKGNWRSLTAVGMGIHNFKVERGIHNSILNLAAKKNSVRGLSLNISEEITYDWKVNEKTTIQPFAAVDMSWNRISSFTDGEIGALNMHVAKQTAFIAEFTVGGRYIRDFACVTDAPDATWYFQLGVAVAAGDVDSDMDCNFVGTPDKHFTIKAADRDRVGLDLGTGLTVPVNANWAIYGNAEIILRGDSHHLNAQIGAQYAF